MNFKDNGNNFKEDSVIIFSKKRSVIFSKQICDTFFSKKTAIYLFGKIGYLGNSFRKIIFIKEILG